MRLTLRTMLAYLDNVLEPSDAELLGKKIEESEFATTLVQRIKTVAKKVRMNAPRLDGKGTGNDANTVSEYLDSALPQDRVGDFERVCLESDAHLAEVASCHQILTLVLGKAADVPLELRDRIYALGSAEKLAAASNATTEPALQPAAAGPAAAATATQPAAEVPDYLRTDRRRSIWPLVGTVAALFALVGIGLRMMGPFDGAHPLARMFGGQPAVVVVNPTIPTPPVPGPTPPSPPEPAPPVDPTPMPMPVDVGPVPMPMPLPVDPMPPAVTPVPMPPVTPPVDTTPKPPVTPPVIPTPPDTPDPTPPTDPKPAILPGVDVGRFNSDEQVLAQFFPKDGVWMRLAPRAVLTSGVRLVSLPTFRPQIALASGVQITFAGESSVVLEQPNAAGASRMTVEYGRLLVVTSGAAGAQLELNLGGISGVLTLADADSALAIQVKRWLPPGAELETTPPLPVVEIFTTNGHVSWEEAGQEKLDIPPHRVRAYVGADPPEMAGPYAAPDWIDARSIPPIDRESSLVLEEALVTERPLNLSLMEKTQDRRVNVRALAARCLGALDEFDPLLKELTDSRQYSFWTGEFAALRHALTRRDESSAALIAAIQRVRPAEGPDLLRLLIGYSPEQLAAGGAPELVKFLEHEQMDVRVAAFQNLLAITGAMEFYRPDKKPEDQKPAIQNWKDRAMKGMVVYKTLPSPIEAYKPSDKPIDTAAPSLPSGTLSVP